jgi:hypothetical protein
MMRTLGAWYVVLSLFVTLMVLCRLWRAGIIILLLRDGDYSYLGRDKRHIGVKWAS